MIAKCKCLTCSGNIEFEDALAGQDFECPHCGVSTTLFVPQLSPLVKAAAAAPPMVAPAIASTQPSPLAAILSTNPRSPNWEYLKGCRKESCYAMLRMVINICFVLIYVFCGLIVLGSINWWYVAGKAGGGGPAMVLFSVYLAFLCAVVAIALHQAALLLVDATDLLIRMSRKI